MIKKIMQNTYQKNWNALVKSIVGKYKYVR